MRKTIALVFFQFLFFSIFSQDINYAREIVDTLTLPYFAGRGAVDSGEKKAANYIANQFKNYGLKPIENSFFQEFNAPINTFPKRLDVSVDGKKIAPGTDFIVDAASRSVNGIFELYWCEKELFSNQNQLEDLVLKEFFANKFIVLDVKSVDSDNKLFQQLKLNKVGAAGVIFLEEKLTQHLSASVKNYPILHVQKEVLTSENKSIAIIIDQQLKSGYQSQNVIGFVKGTEYPDSFIVLSAHYDHLGKMGSTIYFPGANDNASGVAMLLNLVKHYTSKEPPVKSIVFIAFGAEESGLIGSKYFVDHPTIPLAKINFVFNMDLMGTGSEGGMIVNGRVFEQHFNKLIEINNKHHYLPLIKKRGKAANSDHYWFSENGVPSFFIYLMGGISAYHDVDDISETLPLTKYEDTFRLIRDFVDEL